MIRYTNQALAAACAIALVFGSASAALADRGENGHGNGHGKHKNAHANSATAHSCVNPAGNTRGWCKSQMGSSFINGTVTSINGNTAMVTLANGQEVAVNESYLLQQGRGLTVGQTITLRGTWQGNTFVVNNRPYTNNGGPYNGATVSGMIVSVSGNSMQIVQGFRLVTIDFSNAAARGAINGSLNVGRSITASGNWSGSTFIASSIQ